MEINGGFKITEEVLKKYEITATWIVELRLSAALNIILELEK